jgi:uncharacterized protein (DUF488 family)
VTIGVYGYEEETFFQTLQAAGVDTFCDLRQRRGVRGARYAFANSQRLQRRLAEMGIRYVHHKELAPTKAIRALQEVADKAEKVPRRQRRTLGAAFKAAYREEILGDFDAAAFVAGLPAGAAVVALFCVEGEPAACHRSLLAEKLQGELAVEVEHLVP